MRALKKLSGSLMMTAAVAATVGVSGSAYAQLEEIVVTAEFRENNVQDTPIAITAMSSDMLDARGITEITELSGVSPNLTLSAASSNYGAAAVAYIRGVGQYDSNFAFEPGVGMYVDDVYHGVLHGSLLDLLDLERVEVLRGPQGTLAGKNSIGGSVKLFSAKPEGTGEGYVELTVGDADRTDIRAAYDMALTDSLFMRVSAMSKQREGHVKRLDFACANPGLAGDIQPNSFKSNCEIGKDGGENVTGARLGLRWLASDDVEVNVSIDKINDESGPVGATLIAAQNSTSTSPGGVPYDSRFIPADPYTNYATYGPGPTVYSGRGGTFAGYGSNWVLNPTTGMDAWGGAVSVDWQISENLSLKSTTGYRDVESFYSNDQDLSPLVISHNENAQTHQQFSQEIRLSGISANDALDWTVGAYYYDADSIQSSRLLAVPEVNAIAQDTVNNSSESVFAHMVYHVTDSLNVTAGVRYTDDEKSFRFSRTDPHNGVPATGQGIHNKVATYSGDNTDKRVGVDYRWNDSLMTYIQYSTGYKGGGTNPRPIQPEHLVSYNPETVDAYEIGLKSDLLDGKMRLNLSAFLNEYTDIILIDSNGFIVPGPSIVPINAGDADIQGIELEVEYSPTDNIYLTASVSTLDFEYQSVNPDAGDFVIPGVISLDGIDIDDVAPFTPEYTWSVSAAYTIPMASGATITPSFSANYRDDMYADPNNTDPYQLLESYTMVNARVTWESAEEDWKVALFVTNLGDEEYYTNVFDVTSFTAGSAQANIGRPREFGLTVKRSF